MAFIGYARTGKRGGTDAQFDALRLAGCNRVFEDRADPGKHNIRPALTKALAYLRRGDVLVVWRLNRLGYSLAYLVDTLADFDARGIGFRSLEGPIDTTGPNGNTVLMILKALASFKRDMILEQIHAGLRTAITSGKLLGRPPIIAPEKIKQARDLIAGGLSMAEAARRVGISRISLHRKLQSSKNEPDS